MPFTSIFANKCDQTITMLPMLLPIYMLGYFQARQPI